MKATELLVSPGNNLVAAVEGDEMNKRYITACAVHEEDAYIQLYVAR